MKMKLIMMLFVLFVCIGNVYGGNNTTDIPNPKIFEDNDLNVKENTKNGYIDLSKYKTGNNIIILFIIFICVIILTRNR